LNELIIAFIKKSSWHTPRETEYFNKILLADPISSQYIEKSKKLILFSPISINSIFHFDNDRLVYKIIAISDNRSDGYKKDMFKENI
jgi:hypothetical protein